jgi:chromosome segregation ATPase
VSFEEKLEFLRQSIDSHDRQIGELVEQQAATDRRLGELATGLAELRAVTQLNFERLTHAMLGLTEHVTDHKRRIENLEQHS